MSLSRQQTEELKRVILKVMREQGLLPGQELVGKNKPSESKPAAQVDSTALQVRDKLVTWEQLSGRISGFQSVVVPAGAVITPTARDELKERGISLNYREAVDATDALKKNRSAERQLMQQQSEAPAELTCLLFSTDARYQVRDLAQTAKVDNVLTKGASANTLEKILSDLGRRVDCPYRRAVIITTDALKGACLANRDDRIRAAVAADLQDVVSAVRSLQANVLLISPVRCNFQQMHNLIRHFLRRTEIS